MMWTEHEFSCWVAFERAGIAAGYTGAEQYAGKWVQMTEDAPCTCAPVTPQMIWAGTAPRKLPFTWYLEQTKFDREAGFEVDRFRSNSRDYIGILARMRALFADLDEGKREPTAVLELIRQLEQEAA